MIFGIVKNHHMSGSSTTSTIVMVLGATVLSSSSLSSDAFSPIRSIGSIHTQHPLSLPVMRPLITTTTTTTNTKLQGLSRPRLEDFEPEDFELEIPFITQTMDSDRSLDLFIGEEAGKFDMRNEKWGSLVDEQWLSFVAAVGAILSAVFVLWIYYPTGYADDFTHFLEHDIAHGNSHLVTLLYGFIFPLVHSGLASLRPAGEKVVGPKMWRVIFAFPSLCLSYSWISYFIAHAHDGIHFYNLSHNPYAHMVAFTLNFVSFLLLYPSVFNLKEVAAIEAPKVHLWETGIIRITRHPQFVGQIMWSTAHLAMIGTSFTALTMALLVVHHWYACYNGDRRLLNEHGDDFIQIKERTSIIPFLAILEGKQVLPADYYKELLRGPYFIIAFFTLCLYFAHPYMIAGAAFAKNTPLVPGGIFNGFHIM